MYRTVVFEQKLRNKKRRDLKTTVRNNNVESNFIVNAFIYILVAIKCVCHKIILSLRSRNVLFTFKRTMNIICT